MWARVSFPRPLANNMSLSSIVFLNLNQINTNASAMAPTCTDKFPLRVIISTDLLNWAVLKKWKLSKLCVDPTIPLYKIPKAKSMDSALILKDNLELEYTKTAKNPP